MAGRTPGPQVGFIAVHGVVVQVGAGEQESPGVGELPPLGQLLIEQAFPGCSFEPLAKLLEGFAGALAGLAALVAVPISIGLYFRRDHLPIVGVSASIHGHWQNPPLSSVA